MITKKFFTDVSPKAAEGIRQAYVGMGAEVSAVVAPDGTVTVVVAMDDDPTRGKEPRFYGNNAAA